MRQRVVIYLEESDEVLRDWYYSIPKNYRSTMMRVTLHKAIEAGFANLGDVFPNLARAKKAPAHVSLAEEPREKAVIPPTAQGKKPASLPQTVEPSQAGTATREEMIAMTLQQLPQDCSAELKEIARRYPRVAPYTIPELEELAFLDQGVSR